ncbi:MAG TPA: tryptophan--tRNA ligase [Candidatus Aminicenantes bacterium]|nr:tryptophan--tRNA ligase [Candidatus Aminicenantes bacterium]
MSPRKRILSGIQPSGAIHIGNYFGAIENWVRLMDDYECFFTIVDLHAITISYDPKLLQRRVWDAVLDNMAAGLGPKKCTLFIQSHVPEHTELCWLLNCVTPLGELNRMTQFKEKSEQERENVTAGLLNYPILQAADILIYRADAVPVGEDQAQHLELTREIARRFNGRFGGYFPEPATLVGRGARILGIDGAAKMSKSLGNAIGVTEDPDAIWEKLRPAKTDEARKRRHDPGEPDRCNIYSYHKLATPEAERAEIARGCRGATIGCIDCKKIFHRNLMAVLDPVRERRQALARDPEAVREALRQGAERARRVARETLDGAKKLMGLL